MSENFSDFWRSNLSYADRRLEVCSRSGRVCSCTKVLESYTPVLQNRCKVKRLG